MIGVLERIGVTAGLHGTWSIRQVAFDVTRSPVGLAAQAKRLKEASLHLVLAVKYARFRRSHSATATIAIFSAIRFWQNTLPRSCPTKVTAPRGNEQRQATTMPRTQLPSARRMRARREPWHFDNVELTGPFPGIPDRGFELTVGHVMEVPTLDSPAARHRRCLLVSEHELDQIFDRGKGTWIITRPHEC